MSLSPLEMLIDCQDALIVALDSGTASSIEVATRNLGQAIESVRNQTAWDERSAIDQVNHALKQTHAARIRVNYLSEWTRQKIDQLADLRGLKIAANRGKY